MARCLIGRDFHIAIYLTELAAVWSVTMGKFTTVKFNGQGSGFVFCFVE